MAQCITDIVVTTRNRLECLQQTIEHILGRTRSPYALHVIDDASSEGNGEYLLNLWYEGKLASLFLRRDRGGQMANLNVGTWLSFSDPVVMTDDDVLCPDVEPDWLARGLAAMTSRSDVGILALNHPLARRIDHSTDDGITYCKCVGGTFMFVRRRVLVETPLPHYRDNFGTTPTLTRCGRCTGLGLKVAYLNDTHCCHIGHESILTGRRYGGRFVTPKDWKTLEPPDKRI